MDRTTIGVIVGAAFAFSLACFFVIPPAVILMAPGVLIAVILVRGNILGHSPILISLAVLINTLIYSLVFGLIVRFLKPWLLGDDTEVEPRQPLE